VNPSKRNNLRGALMVLNQVRDDEAQDLKDQPDPIEDAVYSDTFRKNVEDLTEASRLIEQVINR